MVRNKSQGHEGLSDNRRTNSGKTENIPNREASLDEDLQRGNSRKNRKGNLGKATDH